MQILIPVNRLDQAKSRLAGLLTPAERRQVALLTLETVVAAARSLAYVHLLSADASLLDTGDSFVPEDPDLRGLNAQLEMAIERIGVGGVLILHADLPLASAPDLMRFVASAPPAPSVNAIRSADGGTNAMLLQPAGKFRLAYGSRSFVKHEEAAEEAGMTFRRHRSERLELDLDSPADVAEFMERRDSDGMPLSLYLRSLQLPGRKGWRRGKW
jgi:2-phospho-L-lactate guanylyltransferase